MKKSKAKDNQKVGILYKGIELLNSNMIYYPETIDGSTNLGYNINVEANINPELKIIFLESRVEIFIEPTKIKLAEIEVRNIFEISNFNEVVTIQEEIFEINEQILKTLQIISIGTTRGIMYSNFKGTFLHGAILPLLDPQTFDIKQIKNDH